MKKNVLVACGFGSVTSRTIAVKLEKFFKDNNIDYNLSTCRIHEVKSKLALVKYDLIVSSTPVPSCEVPNIVGTAILTGVGQDKIFKKIMDILMN